MLQGFFGRTGRDVSKLLQKNIRSKAGRRERRRKNKDFTIWSKLPSSLLWSICRSAHSCSKENTTGCSMRRCTGHRNNARSVPVQSQVKTFEKNNETNTNPEELTHELQTGEALPQCQHGPLCGHPSGDHLQTTSRLKWRFWSWSELVIPAARC